VEANEIAVFTMLSDASAGYTATGSPFTMTIKDTVG
jgi:hypothetical protein